VTERLPASAERDIADVRESFVGMEDWIRLRAAGRAGSGRVRLPRGRIRP
jgi:hypothetical protein